MFDLSRQESIHFQCVPSETNEELLLNGGIRNQCGNQYMTPIFFILYQIIVTQIFLNLFIAIIIDVFLTQNDLFSLEPNHRQISTFVYYWSKYDPEATGFITLKDLNLFIVDLANDETTLGMLALERPSDSFRIRENETFR